MCQWPFNVVIAPSICSVLVVLTLLPHTITAQQPAAPAADLPTLTRLSTETNGRNTPDVYRSFIVRNQSIEGTADAKRRLTDANWALVATFAERSPKFFEDYRALHPSTPQEMVVREFLDYVRGTESLQKAKKFIATKGTNRFVAAATAVYPILWLKAAKARVVLLEVTVDNQTGRGIGNLETLRNEVRKWVRKEFEREGVAARIVDIDGESVRADEDVVRVAARHWISERVSNFQPYHDISNPLIVGPRMVKAAGTSFSISIPVPQGETMTEVYTSVRLSESARPFAITDLSGRGISVVHAPQVNLSLALRILGAFGDGVSAALLTLTHDSPRPDIEKAYELLREHLRQLDR